MPYADAITSFIGLQNYVVDRWKRHHKKWIELWLRSREKRYRCSGCGRTQRSYHDREWMGLRDLDLSKHRVRLWVLRHRIDCGRCGIHRESLGLARRHARCTKRFERRLFVLTRDMTVKAVARLMGVDWEMVKDAEVRYIAGLLRKRDLKGITDLGIDEISEKKGHKYLTLVTDIQKRRVIWVGKNNNRKVLKEFFHWFGNKRTRRLKRLVIDMHDPFELEIRVHCPRAALIYDHFHVIKPLSFAIDNIRRRLQSQLPPEGRRFLKNSRYLLLRARENLSRNQRVRLKELLSVNETLSMAYILKEDLRGVFRLGDLREARTELKDWKRRARESKIPEIVEYVRMLNRQRYGILNFFRHHKTNGLSEGLNNVAKTLKKDAYGFHDWQYFRLKILRKCGKLETP